MSSFAPLARGQRDYCHSVVYFVRACVNAFVAPFVRKLLIQTSSLKLRYREYVLSYIKNI